MFIYRFKHNALSPAGANQSNEFYSAFARVPQFTSIEQNSSGPDLMEWREIAVSEAVSTKTE